MYQMTALLKFQNDLYLHLLQKILIFKNSMAEDFESLCQFHLGKVKLHIDWASFYVPGYLCPLTMVHFVH